MDLPFRAITRTIPWVTISVVTVTCLCAIRLLRSITFTLAGFPPDENTLVANEVVCVLYAVITVALVAPPMPEVDLRRPRAKRLALLRALVAGLGVVLVSTVAAQQTTIAYRIQAGTAAVAAPESELLIHNSLLIFGISLLSISQLGRLIGIPIPLAAWVAGVAPLFFFYDIELWPLATFRDAGPWFSPVHVITCTAVNLLALATYYATAGAGQRNVALDKDRA